MGYMTYADYRNPGKARVIIDGQLAPVSEQALEALAWNAQLLSLGDPSKAKALEAEFVSKAA
jgi:hypothetical protein